ncbi:MAG: hypothetical protein H7A51_13395 [Akkermansiaceae bacterium]|nr:hypothetical protein [Akkermansiaceae bacterium]
MNTPEYTQDELIRLWRPQALQKAENGKSVVTISQFLISKGVEESNAIRVAQEIMDEGKNNVFRYTFPLKLIGWIMVVVGLVTPFTLLALGHGLYIFTFGPLILGLAIVWGGYTGHRE